MSGNAGIRGYIIQTIICMLDALDADNEWVSVTLEPLDESEKVDIKWVYPDNIIKLTQVKSSQNIIRHPAAKKWCQELESHSPNASEYELILIGSIDKKLLQRNDIGRVKIGEFRPLNTDFLIDQASTKIDYYYEKNGKPKISSKVREIIVNSLSSHFGNSSIIGREITRLDFNKELLEWVSAIENQIETNPLASLAPPIENKNIPINHRITKKILELIGWNQFGENYTVEKFNERKSDIELHAIDFEGDLESNLTENTGDFVMVTSLYDTSYPETSRAEVTKYLDDVEIVLRNLKDEKKVPLSGFESTNYYSLLFWLTTDNKDLSRDFIHEAKDNYKQKLLSDELTYLLIDNKKANFLISSIVTAKNYRDEVPVKFLYPITEENQSPGKIGQRGLKLPVQYINSSVIPIAKEDKSKISFLLFCSDPFSPEALKKLIWLTIRLTSGFGNEYLLYFPDYNEKEDKNETSRIIRSFNEELLNDKIKVLQFNQIETVALDSLPSVKVVTMKNETYDEIREESLANEKHLNEAFINILPYGDILKPFLKTDAITPNDMKIFLAKKGFFVKKADKSNLITLMTTLLFSPDELDDFKSLIDIKDRSHHSTNEHYKIRNNDTLANVFKIINPSFENITDGLNTKIVNSYLKFQQSLETEDEYILSLTTEIKDPTRSLAVNTTWGKSEIVIKKDNDRMIVATKNTITREDKLIANRALKIVHAELNRIGLVEDLKIKVMFNSFASNVERVNFLLSFSNISSSSILKDADIQSIKFKFDENTEIPEKFKDKADKDLVITFDGKGLDTLTELSVENAKGSILLEEIRVLYKFNYLNIKNQYYRVVYNFSDALKNKPEINGVFNSVPFLSKSAKIKSLGNIEKLDKFLAMEIESLKIQKFKQFDIIE